jgi:hypothetical protein
MRVWTGVTVVLAGLAAVSGSLRPEQFQSTPPAKRDYTPLVSVYGPSLRRQIRGTPGIARISLDGGLAAGRDRYLVYDPMDADLNDVLRRFRTRSLEFCALHGDVAAPQFTLVTVECL